MRNIAINVTDSVQRNGRGKRRKVLRRNEELERIHEK